MDSLTHLVLGAAIGEVVLGKKIGYKAAVIGAIAETIPDLDVFLNFLTNNEILKLQIHRSYSHAFLTEISLALLLSWLTYLMYKKSIPYRQWLTLWGLGLVTHSLLDCCTTYGTQGLLPFTHTLIGFNNIAVVDVFFTLPFMVFVMACFFMKKEKPLRIKSAWTGISYALLYMVFTLVNKYNVHQHFEQDLNKQHIKAAQHYTSPTMFNNFLWAGIAVNDDSIWLGDYSIMQKHDDMKWVGYPRNTALIKNWPDKHSADILLWFSQGKYFVQQDADTLKFYNVKWGGDFREGSENKALPFYFLLYRDKGQWKSEVRQPSFTRQQFFDAMKQLWRRMFAAG